MTEITITFALEQDDDATLVSVRCQGLCPCKVFIEWRPHCPAAVFVAASKLNRGWVV